MVLINYNDIPQFILKAVHITYKCKGRKGECCCISKTNRRRIISILIRYCPHRYYQSCSCWPAASWCSESRALEKWWPPHCEQSSPCSGPQPESTGTCQRPGESQESSWGHSHPLTPSRWSSARTWCRCLFPGGTRKVNMRPRLCWRREERPTWAIRLFLRSNFRQVIFGRNSSSNA